VLQHTVFHHQGVSLSSVTFVDGTALSDVFHLRCCPAFTFSRIGPASVPSSCSLLRAV
jgi:hypothetical protein